MLNDKIKHKHKKEDEIKVSDDQSNQLEQEASEESEKQKKENVRDYEAEITSLKNQLARTLADYDNLRKRVEQEKAAWISYASQNVVEKLLPVLDTLDMAQKHLNDQGLGMALSQFKKALEEEDLQEICPNQGEMFDHEVHEATERVEGGEENTVSECVSVGWMFKGGRVIRHARVKVYSGEK